MNISHHMSKTCKKRGEIKALTEFSPEKRVLDGRKSRCKPCLAIQARGREEYFREHYRKNRERRLAWMRENFDSAAWHRNRRKNPRVRLDDSFAMLLHYSIKSQKGGRKWSSIVGYTVDDLISHLSARFQPGMALENYGAWHVDHIKPRSAFKYKTEDDPEFRECWALSNLQPLWAIDNFKK